MRKLFICLAFAICFPYGSHGPGWSAETQTAYAAQEKDKNSPALEEQISLAELRNLEAQIYLASAYRQGNGVPQDYKTAVKWYTRAAEQGNPMAQYNLARLYYLGQGVKENLAYAHMWANHASSNGFEMGGVIKGTFNRAYEPLSNRAVSYTHLTLPTTPYV